jgi:creatinine amidohydrolase/Fe(II)-dependent formamide hydrolase-like protein
MNAPTSPGPVSLSAGTVAAVISDVAEPLGRQRIRRLLIVNGHGDRRHLAILGMSAYTRSGVIGRPSLAPAEKGQAPSTTSSEPLSTS